MAEIDDSEALQPETQNEGDKRIDLPPYETIALMLQGGGALGAYQAGVYQGLYEAGIEPNWIAGISIGALNTAIIAGNAPKDRVPRLLQFWETICQPAFGFPLPAFIEHALFESPDEIRKAFTAWQAFGAIVEGQKGFFRAALSAPFAARGRLAADRKLLRHDAASGHAGRPVRLRSHQLGRKARVGRCGQRGNR